MEQAGGEELMTCISLLTEDIANNQLKAETFDKMAVTLFPPEEESTNVAGIVCGVVFSLLAVIAAALCFYFLYWRKRSSQQYDDQEPDVLLI